MRQATHGDTVKVHYRGKLHDGSVFDETFDQEPLRFTIGERQVITGFEEAVVGMKPGDSKTAELPAEKAFGPYLAERVIEVPKDKFARWDPEPTVGERVPIPQPDGSPIDVTVAAVTESKVTVDFNHPLAGEELTIDIELVDIDYGAH
jgi:FKBP-type peptidyl-prolyl cis-trans isomerase 2